MKRLHFFLLSLLSLLATQCSEEIEKIRISVLIASSDSIAAIAEFELKEGKPFSEVVEKFSIGPNVEKGGDIGYFDVEGIKEELRESAQNLQTNQISKVIKVGESFYIIKKTENKTFINKFDYSKIEPIIITSAIVFATALFLVFLIRQYRKKGKFSESSVQLLPEKKYIYDYKSNHPNYNFLLSKLEGEQNLLLGIIGGFGASIISAIIWASITALMKYEIGFMAIAVGLFVGHSVRLMGKGIKDEYRLIGSFFSFLGCILGSLLSIVVITSNALGVSVFSVLENYEYYDILDIFVENFSPVYILFYIFAVAEGYKFSLRQLTKEEIIMLKQN